MDQQVPGGIGATIPPLVFVAFQLMFAVITPALITGATADRWKFGPFVPVRDDLGNRRLRPDRPLGVLARRLALQAGR